MSDVSDVSEAHVASIFRNEVCRLVNCCVCVCVRACETDSVLKSHGGREG
jgi:hypothetical protein